VKWILQNLRQRANFALANPRYTIGALLRELSSADEKFIGHVTGVSPRQIRKYLSEPINTPEFFEHLRASKESIGTNSIGANLFAKKILNQYAAVRALAPEHIVETGIANGVSSAYFLLALLKNGRGHLHSIGLADPTYLPPEKEPGWLVPSWLRDPWQIHFGDSRELLPIVLASLPSIDIFIHDSLHTYEQMSWEFGTAYPFLRVGGLLLSDDALWNGAFTEFTARMGINDSRILRGVGFLRKPTS
jgi:Methyltransferase domain